jgi:hypothetical protein
MNPNLVGSIYGDASYQISDQLALRFQRRRLKCEKLTDDRRRMPSDGKSSHWPLARRAKNVLGLLYTRKTDGFIWPPQAILVSNWPIFKNLLL